MQIQLKPERNCLVIQFNSNPPDPASFHQCSLQWRLKYIKRFCLELEFQFSVHKLRAYNNEISVVLKTDFFIQFHFGVKFQIRSNAPFQQQTTSSNLKLALKYHILYQNNPTSWERAQKHFSIYRPLSLGQLMIQFLFFRK